MRRRYCALALSLCVACGSSGSSSSDRVYTNEAQGYSISRPDGWEASPVRDAVQLATANPAKRKHTIVIRSTEKPGELREGQPATKEAIVATTERVLRGLPGAKLETKATAMDGTQLPAVRMSVSFVPRGLKRPYRRQHAVLIGAKHIYHVFYTSPASEPMDEASFARVVTTLSEEG